MNGLKKIFPLAGCLAALPLGLAAAGAGSAAGQFLKLGVNARALGMGEAYSTVADRADTLFWNPAGLPLLRRPSLSFMHSTYLSNVFYDYAAYAHPLGSQQAWGASLQYLSSRRAEQTDASGNVVGDYRFYDLAATLGYGRSFGGLLDGKVTGGLGVKLVRSAIVQAAATAALDVGLLYLPGERSRFGIAAQNLFGKLNFAGRAYALPFNLKLGYSMRWTDALLTAADLNLPGEGKPHAGLGAEYRVRVDRKTFLSGTLGYGSRASGTGGLSALSLGLGLGWNRSDFHFAWLPMGRLGNSFYLSVAYQFGNPAGWDLRAAGTQPRPHPALEESDALPGAASAAASAREVKTTVAFLGLQAVGVSENEAAAVSADLRAFLAGVPALVLMDPVKVKKESEPHLLRLAGHDEECALLLGKSLNADKVIAGSVTAEENGAGRRARVFGADVQSGQVEFECEFAPGEDADFKRCAAGLAAD